ncbi:MAG: sigma-54 dependent transcriptional regulator [Gemmatimonadota bacterium]|nr:sigma-54 dependent transcriptional regulator [Gemmatimonadota bacterium]
MSERVMLVEDDRDLRAFLIEVLTGAGYETRGFATADEALRALKEGVEADVVVTDLIMPGKRGQELLEDLRKSWPELNVIVITAFGSLDSAVDLIRKGAYDYLAKPIKPDLLVLAVERALEENRLRREVARLRRAPLAPIPGFVAASRTMEGVFELIRRGAPAKHPILVTGESGTGKELAARSVHALSGRDPFVPVNCGALPENLLESELFGHEKGAFTGADRSRRGLFEAADGGTLFLDEIGDLPLALQPKLLRVLEDGEVRRVGATSSVKVDVRLISATNKDLEEEVAAGRFREDILWRIDVFPIRLPPLRERRADIPLIAEHLLGELAREAGAVESPRFSPDAMALLTAYAWPGNVRELRNAIGRAVTLATGGDIAPDHLPEKIRRDAGAAAIVTGAADRHLSLRELERVYVLEVLERAGGNRSRAAELLGLDRKTLYRKLNEWGAET